VSELVLMNLDFHNLNKAIEEKLGLSLVQYHLLRILKDKPGCTLQRLAQTVGMHPSTLTQSIKRFLKKKLIYVEEDPRDSRKKIVGITMQGNNIITKFEEKIELLASSDIVNGVNYPLSFTL
jgi:DNA-binding MarR family transcriptional regulator